MCHISPDQWLAPLDGAILECSLIDLLAIDGPNVVHLVQARSVRRGESLQRRTLISEAGHVYR